MKRIEEKVKDIVDVRAYVSLSDFVREPAQTLAGYHFTDVTSNLMSKWLTRYSRASQRSGAALALAGFRGVGKSHFLAAFGAIISHPELRSRISDSYVFSAAQALPRRSTPVAVLRRGLKPTLIAELKCAVAPIIGCEPESLSDSLNEILLRTVECAGDNSTVLLIDTANERSEHVSRDDGAVLTEIAEIAKTLGIVVGVALDDDISGADGPNSGISHSYSIDYLDQEHLYKIVDAHLFPKNPRMLPVLRDIYEYYRRAVPSFRWSEERFSSLYPLHPAIMEIAPFVRLYMHDFALLSFASEAGSRIQGRPANSLIAPDEVFDKVEKSLREVDALREAFAAYDKISSSVVSNIPVMKRLQAKLILKGLMLFSLNDEGATAAEIGASMLIFDEDEPAAALEYVDNLMKSFADVSPEQVVMTEDSAGHRRFSFKLDGKDDLKTALSETASRLPVSTASDVLYRLMEERYPDCAFVGSGGRNGATDCTIEWRGGLRKGVIFWQSLDRAVTVSESKGTDWVVNVGSSGEQPTSPGRGSTKVISWNPAALTAEETDTLLKLYVLQYDPEIRSQYTSHLAAAIHAHALAAEKIFQRSMLNEAVLSIDGFEYNLTDEARTAQTLSQVFTIMLEPHFEGLFPMHPYFRRTIRINDVTNLVSGFYGGAGAELDDLQRSADAFAAPLGIAKNVNSAWIPVEADELRELPLTKLVSASIARSGNKDTSLETLFDDLAVAPYGLVREAAYLLLSAMVAARIVEFVTSNGDRINHRSLDLKLIWDDIIGVSIPVAAGYSNDRLLNWARLLTDDSSLTMLRGEIDDEAVYGSLRKWLEIWRSNDLANRFDAVPDVDLNTRIWRVAASSARTFRVVAESVTQVIDGTLPLESGLRRIADAFSDSEVEFVKHKNELARVAEFCAGTNLREKVSSWLSFCEMTGVGEIDAMRSRLYLSIDNCLHMTTSTANVDLANLWDKFQKAYTQQYLERHDTLATSTHVTDKLAEIMKTDLWWEFENLAEIDGLGEENRQIARDQITKIRQLDCRHDIVRHLDLRPLCGCGFSLEHAEESGALPEKLWKTVNHGLKHYRDQLRKNGPQLIDALQGIRLSANDKITASAIHDLKDYLAGDSVFRQLSELEIRLLRQAYAIFNQDANAQIGNVDSRSITQSNDDSFIISEMNGFNFDSIIEVTTG